MKVVFDIKENRVQFFTELIKNFDFISVKENDIIIPEHHKVIVRERKKNAKPEDYILISEFEKNLKLYI